MPELRALQVLPGTPRLRDSCVAFRDTDGDNIVFLLNAQRHGLLGQQHAQGA